MKCIFKGFQVHTNGIVACFVVNGKKQTFTKAALQRFHDKLKKALPQKGFTPESEQTKFALDRWPPKGKLETKQKIRQ